MAIHSHALQMSTSSTPSRTLARLEARISPEVKALVQKAADLEGRSLTDFVVTNIQAAAHKVIEDHQTLRLNAEDSKTFVEALLNPSEPNEALKIAAQRYKATMLIDGAQN